jgi:hypothetical protein
MSTPAKGFLAAIECEVVWKNDELKKFCVELVQRALASTEITFTTDIVPDEVRGTGNGIPGSAAHILKTANVITPVGHRIGDKFYPEKVISKREGRNSAHLSVYKLTSIFLANEFLRRLGCAINKPTEQPTQVQTELLPLTRPVL